MPELPAPAADAVARALQPPQAAALQVQAEALKDPMLPPVTVDLTDGLSPDEAAVIAVLANPSLRAVRDARGLADAQLLQAGLLPNPQLSLTLDKPTGGATGGTYNAYGLGASWAVTALVARRAGVGRGRAEPGLGASVRPGAPATGRGHEPVGPPEAARGDEAGHQGRGAPGRGGPRGGRGG